ncbi:hypothetical protein C2G38_2137557 [Gigaspora rosea]|uniref:Uncharacterized protein n=1 Tax=Gigaspora rosea TaxID=44941 RepID=A0A397W329_9GLOM|nr:hypothetical protein C2G38_2137557 [Gigaspora rosea]
MVVLSGDRPNSVNVRFRVSLYSLSSVGCQISVFNKLSTVSSWNGYLRLGFLSLSKFNTGYLSILGIRLLVIEGLEVAGRNSNVFKGVLRSGCHMCDRKMCGVDRPVHAVRCVGP